MFKENITKERVSVLVGGQVGNPESFLGFSLSTTSPVYVYLNCIILAKKMSVKEIRTPASGENQEGETFCCFHVCQEITIVIRIALGCIMIRYTRKKWIEKGDQKPIAECIALL